MSQPPYQPPSQQPYGAPQGPPSGLPSGQPGGQPGWGTAPGPGQGAPPPSWGQGAPPSYGQFPPNGPGGSGGSGGGSKTGLILGAAGLVLGLLIGGGVTAAITSGGDDPKDSAAYQDLEDELADAQDQLDAQGGSSGDTDPSEEPTDEAPDDGSSGDSGSGDSGSGDSGGASGDLQGWSATDPVITEDGIGDYQGDFTVTNGTGESSYPFFKLILNKNGSLVVDMFCSSGAGEEVPDGGTADMTCITSEDYEEDGWDEAIVEYDGF